MASHRDEAQIRKALADFRAAQAILSARGARPLATEPVTIASVATSLATRVASALGFTRSRATQMPYAKGPFAKYRVQLALQGYDPRRGAQMLRNYSRNNEWVRLAIDYRRTQIRKAKWKIVRIDDPKAKPEQAVVDRVHELFNFVNPMRESMKSVLDMVIDDIMVLDAGCIEKEKTYGGDIKYLYAVDGATIVPDPTWDGTNPKQTRYYQVIDGREVAQLRNDQLLYMMETPTTYSPIGWSRVETLMRVIEADLYGEQYDFSMLKQAAPSGIIGLGAGVDVQTVEAFKARIHQMRLRIRCGE